jgi:hypothetical protein
MCVIDENWVGKDCISSGELCMLFLTDMILNEEAATSCIEV